MIMLFFVSCEKYLDKAPEAALTEKEIFGNFISFQGFVEGMYNCVVNYPQASIPCHYLKADETLNNTPLNFDQGDYWAQGDYLYLYGIPASTDNAPRTKKVWPLSWYGIRKANMALSNLDLMTNATQEEKDVIKGQALFFRGWFHFELMRYWGGMPYIDKVLPTEGDILLPRLNYRETALKAAQDFEDAAALLPVDWDDTEVGSATLGNNRQRISKVMALAFLGKNLLFAASPMMNEESTGINGYDTELCQRAAAAFAEVIRISNESGAYALQSWASWTDNFWVWTPGNSIYSGGTEVIMNSPNFYPEGVRWSQVLLTLPPLMGGGGSGAEVPTHNYIKNYAMANGLPIDDPLSGYDPNDPWTNRELRFYKDIIIDGDRLVEIGNAGLDQFAQLYNGGRHRVGTGSVTGYYYKKFSPIGCNQWDKKYDNFQAYVPFMRLADVYLMYAEAVLHGYGTPSSSVPGSITAVEAVNTIRNRAQLPNLESRYTSTNDAFMGEIIRERAVELAFEGQRFDDLRRWNLSGDLKYKNKTGVLFDRDTDGKPINIVEVVLVTRTAEKKHNWLPIEPKFTQMYSGFQQNPGW